MMRSMVRSSLIVVTASVSLATAPAGSSTVSPGDLDPAFGTGGKVTVDIDHSFDDIRGMAIQGDGKIVGTGITIHGPEGNHNRDFSAVRFNSDGSLDSTFGIGGTASTDLGKNYEFAYQMDIQRDEKVVAAGPSCTASSDDELDPTTCDIALVRYNTDGTPDGTFGTNGGVRTDIAGDDDEAFDVGIQRDGKVVAAGVTALPGEEKYHSVLVRYNRNGTLDTTFGNRGKVVTDFTGDDEALAVTIQNDGKIVTAGTTSDDLQEFDFMVARFNTNGTPDTAFSGDGRLTTDFSSVGFDEANAVAVQPDGKILVAGGESIVEATSGNPGSGDFGLVRYNSNGTLDTYFGKGGKVSTHFAGEDEAFDIALQPNGRIVVAGVAGFSQPDGDLDGTGDFAVARYNADGALDTRFSADGKVVTDFSNGFDKGWAVGLQRDGRIAVVGQAGVSRADRDIGAVRYLTN